MSDHKNGRYIVGIFSLASSKGHMGEVDMSTGQHGVDFIYTALYFIPDNKLFAVKSAEQADGYWKVNYHTGAERKLPLSGWGVGVGWTGYFTLCREVQVRIYPHPDDCQPPGQLVSDGSA